MLTHPARGAGSRVRQLPSGEWWSDINPAAQRLARATVLASDDGQAAWATLAGRGESILEPGGNTAFIVIPVATC